MDITKVKEQFNHCAEKYDKHRKYFIPCYDDYYKRSISLLKFYKDDFKEVVDLGAGTGLLTKEMYELYPNAKYTLLDVSEDMLKIAKERFDGLNNFEFIECNYAEDIPANNYDLICSALSIHHLEKAERENLYKNIYRRLDKGGCFVNVDQFCASSETMNTLYNSWWYDYIHNGGLTPEQKDAWLERRKLDKEISIPETVELLKASGFEVVECIYSFMKFGVVLAVKE
jgi:ubiquinone/menaquinone biosynthesis C-methylase UbiE